MASTRTVIDMANVRGMTWIDNCLIDVAGGWSQLYPALQGPTFMPYGSRFDFAVTSPLGDVTALIDTCGTKALILGSSGELLRELNRSYYFAGASRYPLALFTLPDGRTGVVHCPADYNRLEIEVAATGELLTASETRSPADFFHSRLAVSDDGGTLISAGWIWHPVDHLSRYEIEHALADPHSLDGRDSLFDLVGLAGIGGTCLIGSDIAISTTDYLDDPDDLAELMPLSFARWSPSDCAFRWQHQLDSSLGDLATLAGHVLSLNGHPRLFDAGTGQLLEEWPDLPTGESESSIVLEKPFRGPGQIAINPNRPQFAYTDGERAVVVDVSL